MLKNYLFVLFCLLNCIAYPQWQKTKGPYGGDVNTFYENGTALYAGTTAGLFKSEDGGLNWEVVNMGTPAAVTAIIQTGNSLFVGTSGQGIYRSSDSGATWQAFSNGLSTYYRFCGYCITGFHVIGNTLYSATGGGLYKLESNSASWEPVVGGGSFNDAFSANGLIMMSSEQGRYDGSSSTLITTDGGATFRNVNFPGVYTDSRDLAYSLDVSAYGLFAVTSNDLYVSTDVGYTWTSVYHDTADFRPVMVKVIDNHIYLETEGKGLFISPVGSIFWTTEGLPYMSVKTLCKHNQMLFAGMGYNKGVFCKRANSWVQQNNGLTGSKISALESAGNIVVAGSVGGLLISKDSGYTWKQHDLRVPNFLHDKDNSFSVEKVAVKGKFILAGCSGLRNNVFFSLDSGSTWAVMNQTFDLALAGLAIVGNRFIVGAWYELYYSDDFGQSWLPGQLPGEDILWWDIVQGKDNVFISGMGGTNSIYTSTDSCSTWQELEGPTENVWFLPRLIKDSLLLALDMSNGLYMGLKNGSGWNHIDINYSNTYSAIRSVAVTGNDMFISDYQTLPGFIHSPDFGQTWATEQIVVNHKIEQLGSSDNYAYASVPGFGIWRYQSQGAISTGVLEERVFGLQIVPNPSSGVFTITLTNNTDAKVCLYDVLGNCVWSKTNVLNSPVEADLSGQAKGLYFVEVVAEGQKQVKKIVLN